VAASSLGSLMMANPLNVFAQAPGEGPEPLRPQIKPAQEPLGEALKPRILAFDVIETMLDLNALRPQFEHVFGGGAALEEWFSLLLQYAMVVTLTDAYSDFGTIGRATLEMLANSKGILLSVEDKNRIMQGILSLPPHPDMLESLKRLRAACSV
jgi:hypothetical protein